VRKIIHYKKKIEDGDPKYAKLVQTFRIQFETALQEAAGKGENAGSRAFWISKFPEVVGELGNLAIQIVPNEPNGEVVEGEVRVVEADGEVGNLVIQAPNEPKMAGMVTEVVVETKKRNWDEIWAEADGKAGKGKCKKWADEQSKEAGRLKDAEKKEVERLMVEIKRSQGQGSSRDGVRMVKVTGGEDSQENGSGNRREDGESGGVAVVVEDKEEERKKTADEFEMKFAEVVADTIFFDEGGFELIEENSGLNFGQPLL